MFEIDDAIIIFLQNNLSPVFINFLTYVADFGDEIAMISIIGLFYWCLDRKFGLRLYLNLSIANIFYPMLKNVVKRVRPYMANEKIKCFKTAYDGDAYDINIQGYSFPSGHVINCATVYGPIIKKYKNIILRIILVLIISLVSLSRFVLGVHYPSDVLVGLIFGSLLLLILKIAINKFGEIKTYITIAIISIVGFFFCESNDYYTGYGLFLGALPIIIFEDKFKFEETRDIKEIIIRMLGGIITFFLISVLLKLPFSEEFLNDKTLAQYLVRTLRYAIGSFVTLGLYPQLFNIKKKK